MKRFGIKSLEKWLVNENKKPLVLRGVLQVGKSTLVRLFAEENDLDLLMNAMKDIMEIYKKYLKYHNFARYL